MMNTIFIEFDNSKLQDLSQKLYNLFIQNNYKTIILGNNMSIEEKNTLINNNIKPFILSNKINNDNSNTIEIIYPLRNNDTLAKLLSDKLSNIFDVSKYYQLRSLNNTKLDYYEILRNINSEAIIIKYGNNIIDNEQLPSIIFQAINSYLKKDDIYTVIKGDTLYSIARKLNTTVDELKRVNNLSSNSLSIGQKIIVPNSTNNTNSNQKTYTVVSGDSLYAIARKFNTTVDDLKKLNNLTSNLLSIGQKLIIPDNYTNIYTVTKGDTLYSIAKRFNTTVNEIKKINNLNSNNLSIDQKLIIP